jgi:hypothetical protein
MGSPGTIDRRKFLRHGSLALGGLATGALPAVCAKAAGAPTPAKPDYTLNIQPCSLEIAPGVVVKTTAYNGQVPGPLPSPST